MDAVVVSNDDIDPVARNYCSRLTVTVDAGTYYLRVSGRNSLYYRVQARVADEGTAEPT